jgi:hypothetical protein
MQKMPQEGTFCVTAVPASLYTQDRYDLLSPPSRSLYGHNNVPLDFVGQVHVVIERGDRKIEESVFVVRDLATSLLGSHAPSNFETKHDSPSEHH